MRPAQVLGAAQQVQAQPARHRDTVQPGQSAPPSLRTPDTYHSRTALASATPFTVY